MAFAQKWQRESRAVVWVRRTLISLALVQLALGAWGMFRRIRQVLWIELDVPASVLTPGSTIGYDVVTSGEVPNRIRLELIQDAHVEVLHEQRGGINAVNTWDPRIFRYTPTITISRELLSRFHAGPATLRLTGFGAQKLLRTPGPRAREVAVTIAPSAERTLQP